MLDSTDQTVPYRKRNLALYRGQGEPDALQRNVLQPCAEHNSRCLADSWIQCLLRQPPLKGYRGKELQSLYGWGGQCVSDVSTFRSSSSLKCRLLSSIADICEHLDLNFNTTLFDLTGSDRSGSVFIGLNHAASHRYVCINCCTYFATPAHAVSIVAYTSRHSAYEHIAKEEIESTKCNGNDMEKVMIETHRMLEKMLRDLFIMPVVQAPAPLSTCDAQSEISSTKFDTPASSKFDDVGVDGVDYAFMCES